MSDAFLEPAREISVEKKIQKSRFIASVLRSHSEDEARDSLKEIQNEHRQASHNCWAYRIGPEPAAEYSSDDGEPSGTAGKPILGAILRAEVTNSLLVVTRYFGGIKLGVRGLIDAYASSASEALEAAGRVRKRQTKEYLFSVPYEMSKSLDHLFTLCEVALSNQALTYGEIIEVICRVPLDCRVLFE
ncbi:MAG: YigZ family protein [Synergistaceae bacterium]|nr:YigZ family protein [Synergistaceae bacterium]